VQSGLNPGSRVGAYEVHSPLGAGGMGEVYRARDTKLGRDVALKVLPPTFAHDPERVARFHREAQVLAALNHAHIGAIHGFEELNGVQVLVLELVDGETLAARLKRGPLPLDEAIVIARQIADALGAAHEKGIVHRDLKPANIALSSQDQVKVLDFGLARALEVADGSDTSNSPTLTIHATQAGVILGTAAYMSPEQAKGRVADKRADIWSFGCVLYEMLTGRRAFEGEDVSDTLAAVLRGDPDWSALPEPTPRAVRMLIQRCLLKDRKERIADIAVASYVLQEPGAAAVAAGGAAPVRLPRWRAVALPVVALVAGAIGWQLRRPSVAPPQRPTTFTLGIPSEQIMSEAIRRSHYVAISPDGRRVAYIANDQIYLRTMEALEASPVRGSHEQPSDLAFSPDGEWLVYASRGRLKKIPAAGGTSIALADVPITYGISWSGDRILVGGGVTGILEIPATGGAAKTLVPQKGGVVVFHGPQLLPDGHTLLFTAGGTSSPNLRWADADIVLRSLRTGEEKTLIRGGTDARFLPSGYIVYANGGVLYANAFDVDSQTLRGGPTALVEGVSMAVLGSTGSAAFSISNSGTLIYVPSTTTETTVLAWKKRDGTETLIDAPPHLYDVPRMSPDGKRIAVHAADQENDIWVWDIAAGTLTRLTFDKSQESFQVWTPDSKRVIYVSLQDGSPGIFSRAADGTGRPEPLLPKATQSGGALVVNAVTADGKLLIYSIGLPSDIMALPLDGPDRTPHPVLNNPQYAERGGHVSANNRFIAYQSDESGTFQIYVRPFPNVDQGRWQVSSDGGSFPLWSPDGRTLYYTSPTNQVLAVPVQLGASFAFGKPTVALDFSDRTPSVYRNFDVTPDGSQFVITRLANRARGSSQIVVVLNWFDELLRRVGAGSD
jgi:Tol biopolymer transport system component